MEEKRNHIVMHARHIKQKDMADKNKQQQQKEQQKNLKKKPKSPNF